MLGGQQPRYDLRILFVLNKPYAQDPRAQRQIAALASSGHLLDVVCFKDSLYPEPVIEGVRFHRLPLIRRRRGRLRYLVDFAIYFLYSMSQVLSLLARRRYAVVQIYVVPELMILLSIVPRLFGVSLVTDWMDLGYELYRTRFAFHRLDPFPWLIHSFERLIVRWSQLVLVPNTAFLRALAGRGVVAKNALVIMNCADEQIFKTSLTSEPRRGPLRLVYSGTITHRNGADLAVAGAAQAFNDCGDVLLTMIGEAGEFHTLTKFSPMKGLERFVVFTGRLELSGVVKKIATSDIGLITTRDTIFTRINVPTRIYEYGVMGKSVICADLEGIRDYFDDSCVLFHRPGDLGDIARCIRELRDNPCRAEELAVNLQNRCRLLSWETMKKRYCTAMETGIWKIKPSKP